MNPSNECVLPIHLFGYLAGVSLPSTTGDALKVNYKGGKIKGTLDQ